MKKVFIIIVSLLFCTTIYAKSTYAEAQNLANDYIKKFPNYQRYFVTKNTNFGFNTSNSIVNNSDFKSGGLINEQEYRIASGSINSSYLFNGLTYFTMTESGGQVKVIDPTASSGINSLNKISATSGVRVTNYVSDEVKLRGVGTRVSPWKFIERYNVTFEYDDSKIRVSPSTTTVAASTENVSGIAKVTVTPTTQYTYVPQTTCGTIDSNGVLTVTGITRDTICRIDSTLREYTVSIDANGGTFKSNMNSELGWTLTDGNTKATKKIIYSEKIGTLPNDTHMERTGYSFDGVFNGATVINSNIQITSDTELTIKWKANKYKVTYNANGGSISPEYVELTYAEPYRNLHTPSRSGYEFKGWYKDSELNTPIEEGTTILNTASDHTIYAKWEARKFTVTYHANGGSGTMSSSEAIYDTNFVTRQNTFTRTNYIFNGWNEKADGTGTKWTLTSNGVYENGNGTHPWKWTYTKNITLYAQWKANDYTLTYNSQGGSACSPASIKKTSGSAWGTLCTPTKAGYTFDGWYTEASGGTKITSSSTASSNITVYAHWTGNTYTLVRYSTNYMSHGNLAAQRSATVTRNAYNNYTIKKGTNSYGGASFPLVFTVNKKYRIDYTMTRTAGTMKAVGGHMGSATVSLFMLNGTNKTSDYTSNDYKINATSNTNTIRLEFTYKKSGDLIYLQPNRGVTTDVTVNITDLTIYEIIDEGTNKVYGSNYTSSEVPILVSGDYAVLEWYNNNAFSTKITTSTAFTTSNATFDNVSTAGTKAYIYGKVIKKSDSPVLCTLTADKNGVKFAERKGSSYGMSTSSTPTYNSKTSLALSANTFYGFVKEGSNTLTCSLRITASVSGTCSRNPETVVSGTCLCYCSYGPNYERDYYYSGVCSSATSCDCSGQSCIHLDASFHPDCTESSKCPSSSDTLSNGKCYYSCQRCSSGTKISGANYCIN